MPIPHARRMNLIALALLIMAPITFVTFHFLPWEVGGRSGGPLIWILILDDFKNSHRFDLARTPALAAFLASTVVIGLSPFLTPKLRRSRPVWWLFISVAFGSTLVWGGVILLVFLLASNASTAPGPGMPCLVAAQILNLLGLLFIRRDQPADLP